MSIIDRIQQLKLYWKHLGLLAEQRVYYEKHKLLITERDNILRNSPTTTMMDLRRQAKFKMLFELEAECDKLVECFKFILRPDLFAEHQKALFRIILASRALAPVERGTAMTYLIMQPTKGLKDLKVEDLVMSLISFGVMTKELFDERFGQMTVSDVQMLLQSPLSTIR